ncbi:hypothetical protein [Thermogemmatispora sp.]|uniref:hypothetical protein n=1 Tax=Thermogemmatispora sp. TaxID=1968838 RepID=UPI0035E3FEAA
MTQKNIVIVTSDALLGFLLPRALQAQGYETALCESAEAALAYLAAKEPALLIVDQALSDDTGWGLLRRACARGLLALRELGQGQHCLPVVLLSANPCQRQPSPELRPLACLPRICPLGAVLRLVARACPQRDQKEAEGSQSAPTSEATFSFWEEGLYA